MNDRIKQYFKELDKYRNLSTIDDELMFSAITEEIIKMKEPETIPLLLDYFDDNIRAGDITFQHLENDMDYFNPSDYIPCLLIHLKNMIKKAMNESGYLLSHLFNFPEKLKILKENIHLADKESLLKLLNYLEEDDCPKPHKPIIAELRKMVNK